MQNKNQEKQKYVVRLFRKDQEVLDLLVSEDFKSCKEIWNKLHQQWQNCHKEEEVFVLEKPIMTAFEPGLISEIILIPYTDIANLVDNDNPYQQEMQKRGLVDTMKGVGNYPEMLDGGFK